MRSTALVAAFATFVVAAGALAQAVRTEEHNPALRAPRAAAESGDSPGIIVKFRSGAARRGVQAQAAVDPVSTLEARGFAIRESRRLPAALHLLKAERLPGESLADQLARLRADADVEFAEPDVRRYPHAIPSDPLYAGQWYLQNRVDAPSAIHAEAAWDAGKGDAGVVIAVLDTGVLFDHPDLKRAHLGGRLLPGYDFVSNVAAANDGNGRDADASDAGDWVTQQESNQGEFAGCDVHNSSWHGTRVAGIIGALTNNAEGVAGGTWSPWILPVRVLGKCGGRDSDIIEAMAWAGGLHVDGVPDNPYPAKIENLSLGAFGPCGAAYASVISELAARGVLVVASAGNEGGPVGSPANCAGAAAVTGLRHAGTKVGFASLGPQVAVGAPGGNCVNTNGGPCLFSIDTTYNTGTQAPAAHGYTNQTNVNVGTSFAAPIVSGIVGLMAGVNGNLNAAQLRARLREGATTPFPQSADPTVPMCHVPTGSNDLQISECNCTTSTCGAGMANAEGALAAALRPIAALAAPATVAPGQTVNLSGAGSAGACNRAIAGYFWEVVSGAGALTGPSHTATTSVNAPATGSFVVRLTVTDDVGEQDAADIEIRATSTVTSAPATAGSNACLADVSPPPPITIGVSPTSVTLEAGSGTQTFTATVTNAQSSSGVTWLVDGVAGGNATVGTITSFGSYTAPAAVPSAATVTVMATSSEDPTKSATAQITITAPPPPPPPPVSAPAASGGGGGAGLDLLLLVCALAGFARRARRLSDYR